MEEADRLMVEEGVGVGAEEEVREKMGVVGEGCQAAAAGYRKRMVEEAEHHMHRALEY